MTTSRLAVSSMRHEELRADIVASGRLGRVLQVASGSWRVSPFGQIGGKEPTPTKNVVMMHSQGNQVRRAVGRKTPGFIVMIIVMRQM